MQIVANLSVLIHRSRHLNPCGVPALFSHFSRGMDAAVLRWLDVESLFRVKVSLLFLLIIPNYSPNYRAEFLRREAPAGAYCGASLKNSAVAGPGSRPASKPRFSNSCTARRPRSP